MTLASRVDTRKIGALALLSVLSIAVVASALGMLIAHQSRGLDQAHEWVLHTDAVLLAESRLGEALRDAERGQRGYLITGRREYLDPYVHAVQTIPALQKQLLDLTADNPSQQERIRRLGALSDRKLAELSRSIDLRDHEGASTATRLVDSDEGLRLMQAIGAQVEEITQQEQSLLNERLAQVRQQRRRSFLLVAVGTATLVVLLVAVTLLVRHAQHALVSQSAQLRLLVGDLKQEARRKDDFLATLAHELRNPLAPIQSAADLLGHEQLSAAAIARATSVIRRQVRHIKRLLDDLLTLTRLTHAKLQLQIADVSARECFESAIEMVQPVLEGKQQRLHAELPPAELHLTADGPRLAQVVANLLLNASKYSEAQQRIDLSARQQGAHLEVMVRDEGIGLAPANLTRVFDRFYQVGASGGRDYAGLGIGLAVAKELVEMHGGSIALNSAGVGRGTTAVVRIPLSAASRLREPIANVVAGP